MVWLMETSGRIHFCTEDGTAGFHGRVTDAVLERLRRVAPESASRMTILACGP